MKLSKISMGIAALCGLAASPVFAITAAAYTPANAMRIYVSGATAMDVGLENAVIGMCLTGTVNKYTVSNQAVWLCSPDTTKITGTAGRQLAVHKHSVGGSGNGVGPVNSSTPLPFLDLSLINTNCAAATGAGTSISCTAATGAVTATAVAPLGISDVEPSFFGAANTFNNLDIAPLATVIFGLPVTTVAYTALQVAQSLTSGATDAANIPSLTTAQITSMFTQEGQSWSSLTGAALADDQVYVARRVDTSGTQKTYEAVIARTANGNLAGKSCNANLPSFLSGPDATDNTAANTLCDGTNASVAINNSGSGQVQACLNRFNTAVKGAIGTLTTEQVSATGWKHVRVNGLLPNYTNVKSGAYTNYGDSTINSRKVPGIGADHTSFRTAFLNLFADVAILHPAFGSTSTDAGKAGLIGLKTITAVATDNPWVRTDANGVTDNCRPARQGGF